MIKLLLLIITTISFQSTAEFSVEFAKNFTEMEWKGASHAKYNYNLKTFGVVWYSDELKDSEGSSIGIRAAYGRARPTLPQNGAALPKLIIELKHSADLELLYRHKLYGKTFSYWGIGYYWDNLPITKVDSDFYKDDWDNGFGWAAGLEHRMTKHSSVQATFRRRNVIGASQRHNGALGSSHNSIGVSIRYIF